MKSIATVVVTLVVLLYVAARVIPIEPDEQRPGTALSGALVSNPNPDWGFVRDRQQIYVQTNTWYGIPHSVTTIAFVADGELYVPCGWCDTKRWPKNVVADPQVVLKIDGRLFPRIAVRIDDAATRERVFAVLTEDEIPSDWALYRMDASG